MIVTCEYCKGPISKTQKRKAVEYQNAILHDYCFLKHLLDRVNQMNDHLGLLMESMAKVLDRLTEIEKNQEAIAEYEAKIIEDVLETGRLAMKIINTMPMKDDVKYLSMADPFLLGYLEKVAGIPLEELVAQVRNVETKRIINQMIRERKK